MQVLRPLILAFAFSMAVFASPFAAAHAHLKNSMPTADATVAESPKEIALTFNEPVDATFSKISLIGADGKEMHIAKAIVDEKNSSILRSELPTLAKGKYVVKWAAVSHDGHRRTGDFAFTVK